MVFKGKSVVAAALSASALILGAGEAMAKDMSFNMGAATSGEESTYWDTAGGTTTIRVDACRSAFAAGGGGLTLNLWENRGWAPDIDRGGQGYGCTGDLSWVYGGSNSWNHANGRHYFEVSKTPNSFGADLRGNVNYPG